MAVLPAQLVTAEFVLNGTILAAGSNSIKTANIFHYRRTATVNPVSKVAMLAGFNTAIVTVVAAALNVSWRCDNWQVRMLEDVTDAYATALPGLGGVAGAITGDRLPPYVAAFILMRTGLRGRQFRGSKFIGPMSESDTTLATADLWNAGAQGRLDAIATAVAAQFTDATPNTWQPCIVSKRHSNFLVVPATIASADVVSAVARHSLGHLKSRKIAPLY